MKKLHAFIFFVVAVSAMVYATGCGAVDDAVTKTESAIIYSSGPCQNTPYPPQDKWRCPAPSRLSICYLNSWSHQQVIGCYYPVTGPVNYNSTCAAACP